MKEGKFLVGFASFNTLDEARSYSARMDNGSDGNLSIYKRMDYTSQKDVNEKIDSYEKAKEFINSAHTQEILRKKIDKITAYERLMTIALAWNKIDGFKIDFDDDLQKRYMPIFNKLAPHDYSFRGTIGGAGYMPDCEPIFFFFKTRKRAEQFGRQFLDLWCKFL